MEFKKMYVMSNIKFTDVQYAKAICDFKNTDDQHCRVNADILI
jgi:hypothetical protein